MSLQCIWRAWGVQEIDPGNTGGTLYHEDFELTFVPAWHSSGIFREGRSIYLGACCGLIIAAREGKTVYLMGDTAIFSDMGPINEIYRPQIGIVPIGDRFTMGAKTAALPSWCQKSVFPSRLEPPSP